MKKRIINRRREFMGSLAHLEYVLDEINDGLGPYGTRRDFYKLVREKFDETYSLLVSLVDVFDWHQIEELVEAEANEEIEIEKGEKA